MKFSDIKLTELGTTIQMAGAIYAGNDRKFVFPFPGCMRDTRLPEHIIGEPGQGEMTSEEWKTRAPPDGLRRGRGDGPDQGWRAVQGYSSGALSIFD